MMVFRNAQQTDLAAICHLAKHSGITTLLDNHEFLNTQLTISCASFCKEVTRAAQEYYLFVLEDCNTKQVVGTSAILARTGSSHPFYSFRIDSIHRNFPQLNQQTDYDLLTPTQENEGKTELCTLFLDPAYRHNHNGLLLSCARFLFMASNPNRFTQSVIAELRGVADDPHEPLFWTQVSSHFFHMPFAQADKLTMTTDKQFIAALLPETPIYCNLLPPEVQAIIGKPHHAALPAMKLLINQGFQFNHTVDIFDAGPTLEAPVNQIQSLQKSRVVTLTALSDESCDKQASAHLIATTQLPFRATLGFIQSNPDESLVIISKKMASLLQVKPGDVLRITPI